MKYENSKCLALAIVTPPISLALVTIPSPCEAGYACFSSLAFVISDFSSATLQEVNKQNQTIS